MIFFQYRKFLFDHPVDKKEEQKQNSNNKVA